ncbi:MAG: acyltransferase [Sedimentisphaerales bacterium]|nr:acyltransferase [Sedimentisphaerales bacterium]
MNNLKKMWRLLKLLIVKAHLRIVRLLLGRQYILYRLNAYARLVPAAIVLRLLGAKIDAGVTIEYDIRIQNARDGDCSNLRIGRHVYIGPGCLLDLANRIEIEDEVALSARVCITTHADPGDRPLQEFFPRREGPVCIRRGAWIGMQAVILHGVTVGELAAVGALSLVNRDVEARSLSCGIPCRTVRRLDQTGGVTTA